MPKTSRNRRFQLRFLVFSAAWLACVIVGVALAIRGLGSPDISDSPGTPWQAYPPGSSVWGFGFGTSLLTIGVGAMIVDGLVRSIALLLTRARRAPRRT